MYLNTDIIYQHLQNTCSVSAIKPFRNPSLYSPLIYDGQTVLKHHIYIIRAEDLPSISADENEIAFLCAGIPFNAPPVCAQDCIMMEESPAFTWLLTLLTEIFDYYNQWESILNECSYDYEGLRKMLKVSRKILGGALILGDFYFNQVAYTVDFIKFKEYVNSADQGRTPSGKISELLSDPEFHRMKQKRGIFEYAGSAHDHTALCYNLFRPGENLYYGRLMLLGDSFPYSATQRHLLKILGDRINRVFGQISVYTLPISIYNNLRKMIRNQLTGASIDSSLAATTLEDLGWRTEDTYLVTVFTAFSPDEMNEMHVMICNQLDLLFTDSCTVISGNMAVMITNISKNKEHQNGDMRKKLSVFLRENIFKAGISNPAANFFNLYTAYLEACVALEIGNTKNSTFWYYYFSDYTLDYIIGKSSQDIPRNNLCHPAIRQLKEWDLLHGTKYCRTLKAYFECQYNATHAAQALYIHRTTFLSRMEKILELTNLDLNDWNTRLHLMISFSL